MKTLKALMLAIAVAVGMIVIPASPASATYCRLAPPSGSVPPGVLQSSGIGEVDPRYSVGEYLEYVIKDADQMWTQWFKASGLCEPEVGYDLVGITSQVYQSNCTVRGGGRMPPVYPNSKNAFFCPADSLIASDGSTIQGMLILPVVALRELWFGNVFGKGQAKVAGDFGAGIVVAHEFGHHVVDEIVNQARKRPPTGENNELIADCFAGIWAYSVNQRGQLEPGDLDEVISVLEYIGDSHISENDHGTTAERTAALATGFRSGQPMACINTYWK